MGFKYEAIKAYLIDHGVDASLAETMHAIYATQRLGGKIGRASCRERV